MHADHSCSLCRRHYYQFWIWYFFSLPEVDSLYAKQFIFHKHIELTRKVITQDCAHQNKIILPGKPEVCLAGCWSFDFIKPNQIFFFIKSLLSGNFVTNKSVFKFLKWPPVTIVTNKTARHAFHVCHTLAVVNMSVKHLQENFPCITYNARPIV